MALPWTVAKFLFKVVAPSLPELVSAVRQLRNQKSHAQEERDDDKARLAELEQALTTQLQLIEQVTVQLQALQKTIAVALWLSVGGLVIASGALGFLFFR